MLRSQTAEYKASRNEENNFYKQQNTKPQEMKENKFYNAEMIQTW